MGHYLFFEKKRCILLIILITLRSIVQIGTAMVLTEILNALTIGEMNGFLFWLFWNILLWAIWLALFYIVSIFQEKTIQYLLTDIRNDIGERISKATYQSFYMNPDDMYASWLNTDVRTLENKAFRPFFQLIDLVITAVLSLLALISYHYLTFFICMILSVIIALVPNLKVIRRKMQNSSFDLSKEREDYLIKVSDILRGFDDFISLNLRKQITMKIGNYSSRIEKEEIAYLKKEILINFLATFLNISSQIIITLSSGLLIILGYLSAGSILTIGQLSGNIFNAWGDISKFLVEINSTKPIFEKFLLIATEEESEELIEPIEEIVFENVNYDYGKGPLFKTSLNMVFKKGGKYAIIGKSGSGKTTMINILTKKLNVYSGSVKINQRELTKISAYAIRKQVVSVQQKNHLFNTTIRNNILMGRIIEDLEEALYDSDAISLINSLPDKMDTFTGQEGRNLSGGQKQKIVLARGLASGCRILIIDEGTSALDVDSAFSIEKKLMDNKDLTVIMITHHLELKLEPMFTKIYAI